MELQEIEVLIDKNGEVKIHVRGVKGSDCLLLTQDLEAALGGQVVSRESTPEALDQPGVEIDTSNKQQNSH
jgi:hypothetical protein